MYIQTQIIIDTTSKVILIWNFDLRIFSVYGPGIRNRSAAVNLDLGFWSQLISYSVSYSFPDLKLNCGLFRPFLASRDWNILHRVKTTQAWQCPEPVPVEPCSEISQTINGNVGREYSKTLIIQHLICFPVFTGVDFYALLTIFYVSYMTQSDTLFIRHENSLPVSVGLY